jgi:hypothetical protein
MSPFLFHFSIPFAYAPIFWSAMRAAERNRNAEREAHDLAACIPSNAVYTNSTKREEATP